VDSVQPGDVRARPRAARSRRWRGLAVGPALVAVITAVCSGCAVAPVSGGPQAMPGASGQPQAFVQPLPPSAPQPKWSAGNVVLGFLHASANFALDPKAVRAYLSSDVTWQPTGGVTIISPNVSILPTVTTPHAQGVSVDKVTMVGLPIATLNSSGQYNYQSGARTRFTFTLIKSAGPNGRWLIEQLPAGTHLLLTQSDFQQVFEPQNLYFFSQLVPGNLVPDPVYVPVQAADGALNTNVASDLVRGLLHGGGQWLSGAIQTAFPNGTKLLGPVVISNNQTAVVNLGGAATEADQGQLEAMYAQLEQTLTYSAYAPAVATSVQLEINGQSQNLNGSGDVVPGRAQATAGAGRQMYFAGGGIVRQLRPKNVVTVPFPQLGGQGQITATAATTVDPSSPHPQQVVAEAIQPQGRGCAVEVATSGIPGDRYYAIPASGGPCTTLSWDSKGDLWAITASSIWVVQPDDPPKPVTAPPGLQDSLQDGSAHLVGFQMAPDGLRGAMLVQAGSRRQLYVAAMRIAQNAISFGSAFPVGTDLGSGPSAFTWDGAYYLLGIEGSNLYQVPLIGDSTSVSSSVPAGVLTVSAAGGQTDSPMYLAVGLSSGRMRMSSYPYSNWTYAKDSGSAPSFPG
jgi:sporulation and spore germination protein/lipoprotein LpqB-like beta-propeller protein